MVQEKKKQLVRSNEIKWKPLNEPGISGIFVKTLRYDYKNNRPLSFLLKFEAGATYPAHNHPGGEEVYVIEGSVKIAKDLLNAGDYLYTAINNKHAVWSKTGCVLLFIVPAEVEILKIKSADLE